MHGFRAPVNEQISIRRQEYLGCAPEMVGCIRLLYGRLPDPGRYGPVLRGIGKAFLLADGGGHDLFILVDVMNYSCRCRMFGSCDMARMTFPGPENA
jgi:hypothetical protein